MNKFLGLIAAVALFGVAGVANAADSQNTGTGNQPAELSANELDAVTAGTGGATSTVPRVIRLGSYSLVFNGSTWSRVKN